MIEDNNLSYGVWSSMEVKKIKVSLFGSGGSLLTLMGDFPYLP